jgi:TatD DNase family protein
MKFFISIPHKFTQSADVLELVNQYPQEFDEAISAFILLGFILGYYIADRVEADLEIIESKL